jgi:hypothetical protein
MTRMRSLTAGEACLQRITRRRAFAMDIRQCSDLVRRVAAERRRLARQRLAGLAQGTPESAPHQRLADGVPLELRL